MSFAQTSSPAPSRDFDFLLGSWKIHNRCLKERLQGSTEWIEFESRTEAQSLLNGLGNMDRYTAMLDGEAFEGITLRLYNPATALWSLYWVDTVRAGILQPPMVGRFRRNVGEFFGEEEVNGKKIMCRFIWTHGDPDSARWEQAFSSDGGMTWETNWTMTFSRDKRQ